MMRRITLTFTTASLLACGTAIFAADKPAAEEAEDSRPVLVSRTGGKGAENLWKSPEARVEAAEAGDPVACYELGEMYLNGTGGVTADVTRAVTLLERSADAGHVRAAFRLGKLKSDGELVPKDLPGAYIRYLAAAKGGSAEGQYNLGAMLSSGRGVKRDFAEGLAWLTIASKNGADSSGEKQLREHLTKAKRTTIIADAERRAGELAREIVQHATAGTLSAPLVDTTGGAGGSRPSSAAPKTDSAPQKIKLTGSAPGRMDVGLPGGGIAMPKLPGVTPPASEESVDKGPPVKAMSPTGRRIQWSSLPALEKAAEAGQADALSDLGQILLAGTLAPAEPARALALLQRGADAGSSDAAYQLAEIYAKGVHQVRDDAKALSYYRQAAKGGSIVAIFNVGAFLANGRGAPRDYTESLAWLLVAKKRGLDQGGVEQRIRAHLQKNAPEQIASAERRADVLEQEIAAAAPPRG